MIKIKFLKFFFVLVTLVCSCASMAGEGFFDLFNQPPPRDIHAKWGAVLFILAEQSKKSEVGTSFVIAREKQSKTVRLLVVTSNHVIGDACLADTPCEKIRLFPTTATFRWASIAQDLAGDIQPISLRVTKRSVDFDLALIEVVVRIKDDPVEAFTISPTCLPSPLLQNYTIGYPVTTERQSLSRTAVDFEAVTKMWTRGSFVRNLSYLPSGDIIADKSGNYAGFTNDGLPGDSGGPVLDNTGKVIGVVKGSASIPENNFIYAGNESAASLDWNITIVRCESLKSFLFVK